MHKDTSADSLNADVFIIRCIGLCSPSHAGVSVSHNPGSTWVFGWEVGKQRGCVTCKVVLPVPAQQIVQVACSF